MARTIRDARLDSRTARQKLAAGRTHWRGIDVGLALGWRRQPEGGTWSARRYLGGGRYKIVPIGIADDSSDADGVAVLSFSQAQTAARALREQAAKRDQGKSDAAPYTVAMAIQAYVDEGHRQGRKALVTAENAAKVHILPQLGDIALADLTTERLKGWLDGIWQSPARLRSSPGAPTFRELGDQRPRKATANRIFAVLRASLNMAWRAGRIDSDAAWRKLRPFANVAEARIRHLTEAECVRLLNACPPDFRKLVAAALASACRYGELTRLRASDFNPDAGAVYIRAEIAKSGKARHVHLTSEGVALFAGLTAGRPGDALIFLRADGRPWGRSHQCRVLAEACKRASITPAISFHITRHTTASLLAMRGVPLPVIAALLGHADTRITERHYAHLGPSYVADAIRGAGLDFGLVPADAPVPLRPRRRR